jgi:hypothetical protein
MKEAENASAGGNAAEAGPNRCAMTFITFFVDWSPYF